MDSDTSPTRVSDASSLPGKGQRRSLLEALLQVRELAPVLGLFGVVLFFTLQTPNFWSPQTMTAITTVASTIGIVAIGVTMLSFTFLGDGVRDALDPKLK